MRKILKTLVFFVLIFAGIGMFFLRSQAAMSDEQKLVSGDTNSARELFQSNCARCHGADGRSQTELGKLYDSPDLTDGRIQKLSRKRLISFISRGKGGMPSFRKRLSSKEIASLVEYVRSF